MTRGQAEIIADIMSDEQLFQLLTNAKEKITDWKKQSKVNFSATIGTTWNILLHDFFRPKPCPIGRQAKIHLLRDFGDYIPEELKLELIKKHTIAGEVELLHQEPNFPKSIW